MLRDLLCIEMSLIGKFSNAYQFQNLGINVPSYNSLQLWDQKTCSAVNPFLAIIAEILGFGEPRPECGILWWTFGVYIHFGYVTRHMLWFLIFTSGNHMHPLSWTCTLRLGAMRFGCFCEELILAFCCISVQWGPVQAVTGAADNPCVEHYVSVPLKTYNF